ncbi:MAG TPA: dihydrolipoyl dehydrogenase [Methanoregula sp.]|nr:dihydrolipoyl dehydrogenase [Methanoregula sp.]
MGRAAKKFDAVVIGTGSGLELVNALLRKDPGSKLAVIDKDDPGGICLNRGCIPSKILLYSAEIVRTAERARIFGVELEIKKIDFPFIMDRMRRMVSADVEAIRAGLHAVPNVRYFPTAAEFVAPYTLAVAGTMITAPQIFLCTGSRPGIPPVPGLAEAGYLTSDTLLALTRLPESLAIIGGGYIAAEYGHFFASMGSAVTIIGRNPRFLPGTEPEISDAAALELGRRLTILTDCEVTRVEAGSPPGKTVIATRRVNGEEIKIPAEEILVATGRIPNSDILKPERGGIATDPRGWIVVDDSMQTSSPGVWAFGDADGRHLFKHVANRETLVVFLNALEGKKKAMDYRVVPRAIFTSPEIASVGIGEAEAVAQHGTGAILIGFGDYADTAKGSAMETKNAFVKLIIGKKTGEILGAHLIGPDAAVLIQELVTVMNSGDPTIVPITDAMHIHPALSEVVSAAARTLMPVDHYHQLLEEKGYGSKAGR